MTRKHTLAAVLLAAVTTAGVFAQAQAPQAPDVSPSRVLAGVRDFTPDALKAMATLAEHREWLETASKAIQAGGKPDLADPKMPPAVKDALDSFADVPELVLLLAARPAELATLRQVLAEAPEGVTLRMQQFRADYSYARREGAIAWQQMLQRDPVALGQYREYLTKFSEQQRKAIPGFAVVRVTDRDYYLACPPDDALMTFAHEASPPEALGRIMAEWWDENGTAAVDAIVADGSVSPRISMVEGAVIDLPAERRKAMWRPADEPAMDTLGLMPVILQPFADQPDPAKVARAVQELARIWSLGDAAPEDAPLVADAPVAEPVGPPAALPDIPVEELAQRAEAYDTYDSYTTLEPRYAWPGVAYHGYSYTPYSSYISSYSYVNGYPYWYCPPPSCGTTYIYYPQCRPTFSYLRDPYRHSGVSFGIHTGSGIRRFGFNYYNDDDCRRYGVYQYGGRHGRNWDRHDRDWDRHDRDWDRHGDGRRGDSGLAIKDRRIHDLPKNHPDIGRGTRQGPGALDGRRDSDRDGRSISRFGSLRWNSNDLGSLRGDRRTDDATPRRQGGLRNPWASPRLNSNVTPRGSTSGSRVRPSVAPRPSPSTEPRSTGRRSPFFDGLRPNRSNQNSRPSPSLVPSDRGVQQRSTPSPRMQSGANRPIAERLQSIRQNWNSRPATPNRSSNFGVQRSGSTPRAQPAPTRPIANKIQSIRQNSRSSAGNRSSGGGSRQSSGSNKKRP